MTENAPRTLRFTPEFQQKLLDIYPKSDQSNIEVAEIRQIINRFNSSAEE